MYETNLPATLAICRCLQDYNGYMSWESIDKAVFHGTADEKLLKGMLHEMKQDGLLVRVSNGCYNLTGKGHMFIEHNGGNVIGNSKPATEDHKASGIKDSAVTDVINNANEHAHKKPNIRTLSEEFAEAILAERGKHEHPLRLELVQIAGICINMIRQIDAGEEFVK